MSKKKRFISLLVAFTMVFSMIVPSLSFASFSDIEGSKYEEAIDLLRQEGTPYDLDYNFLEIDIYKFQT